MSVSDPTRHAALVAMKLGALVRAHAGSGEIPTPEGFGGGAGVVVGGTAWVLLDERPADRLGAAIAWAVRHGATGVHVLADRGTGQLARRCAGWRLPITVSHVEGRDLVAAAPEALPMAALVTAEHRSFLPVIIAGGADPVDEHGVLSGEVRGLEVCRVVDDPMSGAARLEVGVGAHDREIFQMLHGDRPTVEALRDVVATVASHRAPGTPGHPLNRLAASRAVRARVVERPSLIGAAIISVVAPPYPRPNLKDELPCVALAEIDGVSTAVVCSVGIDLDVVPYAVDAIASMAQLPVAACVIVAPERDIVDIQRRLADLVRTPTRFVGLSAADLDAP